MPPVATSSFANSPVRGALDHTATGSAAFPATDDAARGPNSTSSVATDQWTPGLDTTTGTDAGPPNAMPAPDTQQQALAELEHQGQIVEEYFPAVLLHTIAKRNLGNIVSAGGFKKFLDKFIADCGGPKKPIAKLLLEQTAWAHFAVGNLLAEAACAKTPELTATFTAIAARLMSEVRKTGIAVTELISKENEDGTISGHAQDTDSNNELGSNAQAQPSHDRHSESDGSPNCRQVEPGKAQRPHARGSSAAA
jgi:hypothetical protein